MKRTKIIAEIGCNHQGDMGIAKHMIELAAASGAIDFVKFQKREIRELLSASEFAAPHPEPRHSFGRSYGLHREFLEFSLDQHAELKEHCSRHGVEYACSVWDVTSALKIISINPTYLKIPSACNLNFDLLRVVCENFSGPVHVSLGMTTHSEVQEIYSFLKSYNVIERTVFYACVSAYPAPADQSCLLEIPRLKKWSSGSVVGFSGHHLGINLDIAAVALGAEWIERHFTADKFLKGTDQSLSLGADDFKKLRVGLDEVSSALTTKGEGLSPAELLFRDRLKRNFHI